MTPYTKVLPKGLLPIGKQPILEIIVKQLRYYGFDRLTMACGYLAPLIQTYFGDGSSWNVKIRYQVEDHPLGTVGALKNIKHLSQPFLVINCDVLTTLNFKEFWEFHCKGDSLLTIASQEKKIPIHLGVLQTQGDRVIDFVEKPVLMAHVNMGIYMMEPEILRYIPENQFFDIPDLIRALLADNQKIRHFANTAYWHDIGRPEDYHHADEEFPEIKDQLLPGEQR